mmetsp:Transcript_13136/g.24207  ORF Transcript_13136/g.24207 Transcript_13136/m.24207 type:complete len:235 (-) Transcript_13136:118-822(-)
MGDFEIGYWKIRGLAAAMRMMLEYSGKEYKDNQYEAFAKEGGGWDVSSWFGGTKQELGKKNPLINLPYVKYGDAVIVQSNACYCFLGRKLDLNGKTDEEITKNEQILCEVMDLRNDLLGICYPFKVSKEDFPEKSKAHIEKGAPKYYKKFEAWLEMHGTKFLSADAPLSGDFHAWEMLDQHELIAAKLSYVSPLADFPKLTAYYKAFKELPTLQKYFASDAYQLPINNKMAFIL